MNSPTRDTTARHPPWSGRLTPSAPDYQTCNRAPRQTLNTALTSTNTPPPGAPMPRETIPRSHRSPPPTASGLVCLITVRVRVERGTATVTAGWCGSKRRHPLRAGHSFPRHDPHWASTMNVFNPQEALVEHVRADHEC
jgi:hypothetical protein